MRKNRKDIRTTRMTKRKYKEERKKILEKYGRPMSEIPDKYLKDENGCWIWLRDLVEIGRASCRERV